MNGSPQRLGGIKVDIGAHPLNQIMSMWVFILKFIQRVYNTLILHFDKFRDALLRAQFLLQLKNLSLNVLPELNHLGF
jgi:hypothetical protein